MVALKRIFPLGLRGQLALMFGLVAAGPALLAVVLASLALSRAYEREHEARVIALRTAVEREGLVTAERLERAGRELADGPLLEALITGSVEEPTSSDAPDPRETLEAVRRTSGLELLTVQDDRGVILFSAHLPARTGELTTPILPGGPRLGLVTISDGNRLRDVPAMLWARRVDLRGYGVTVEVGARLDAPFVARITDEPEARIWILGAGALSPRVTSGKKPPADGEAMDVASVSLQGPDIRFGVALGGARIDEAKTTLWRITVFAALLLVLLSAAMGAALARRVSQPLLDLQDATVRFGHGESTRAPVGGPPEVRALGAAFNQMVQDVDEARSRALQAERVAAWQQIARRMAHEIKNPLFPIQTSVETLIKARERHSPQEPEIFEETTRTILEEVTRLSRIVTEFSSFARMPEAVPVDVDLMEVAHNVVSLMGNSHLGQLSLDGPERAEVRADKDQLHRLLVNLVKNAQEAVAAQGTEGRVQVRVQEGAQHVSFDVVDNGPGIPLEVQQRLFTPYVTTKPDGTGLGLALVHRIAMDHHADIQVDTGARGTTFRIHWPKPQAAPLPA
ncbi:MAG: ATP-binding protein [Myxococcota bacterium]